MNDALPSKNYLPLIALHFKHGSAD